MGVSLKANQVGECHVVLVRGGKLVLGVCYLDQSGQIPIMNGGYYYVVYDSFAQASADVAERNAQFGLSEDDAYQILRSTIIFRFPRKFRK
jgi:hypothetical protein